MDRMKFQVAIVNRVIIIAHSTIFILYANCIYMYLCISICVYIPKVDSSGLSNIGC